MRTVFVGILVALAFSVLPAFAQDDAAPKKDIPRPERIKGDEYKFGNIFFNRKTREIRFPASVIQNEVILEYAIVHAITGKVHESLLAAEVSPLHLQIVMKLLRYQASKRDIWPAYDEEGKIAKPMQDDGKGRVEFFITATDKKGKKTTVPMSDWVERRIIGEEEGVVKSKTMSPKTFSYTGSGIYEGFYIAEAEGAIAAIYRYAGAMFNAFQPKSGQRRRVVPAQGRGAGDRHARRGDPQAAPRCQAEQRLERTRAGRQTQPGPRRSARRRLDNSNNRIKAPKMKTIISTLIVACLMAGPACAQRDASKIVPNEHRSLKNEIERAIGKGLKFLISQQQENGMWGEKEFPALTALPTTAILVDPRRPRGSKIPKEAQAGLDYLLTMRRLDGGIYGKGLGSYNTALSIMAFVAAEDPKYKDHILKARRFLVNMQSDYDKRGVTDNVFDGGVGYGSSYSHPDLSNTYFALEALAATKSLIAEDGSAPDLDWEAAIKFVQSCQHNPGTNKQDWVSKHPKDRGGFVYFPGKSQAEEEEEGSGKVLLHSYGSMSYAGLLSFIYADLDKDDERVKACLDWLEKNFTVEENPGMGLEGLYYYYHTMAKGLSVAGIDQITVNGKKINWRVALTKKLLNEQASDGSWANTNGRWWEKDKILVTSYCLLSLSRIYEGL